MIHSDTLVAVNSTAVRFRCTLICFKTQRFSTEAFIIYPSLPLLRKTSFAGKILLKYVICQGHFLTFGTHSHWFHSMTLTRARTIVWLESCNFQLCPDFAVVRRGDAEIPKTSFSWANIHLNPSCILNSFTLNIVRAACPLMRYQKPASYYFCNCVTVDSLKHVRGCCHGNKHS